MRPEYVQAVDSASWGITFWAVWLLSAGVTWTAALSLHWGAGLRRAAAIGIGFLTGAVAFWFFALCHLHYVQSVREIHMVTHEEMMDWSSDTGLLFAPITLIPFAVAYSGIHASLAVAALSFVYARRERRTAESARQTHSAGTS